ncbi:MAG: GNAT family N-acetyltransferase [Chitinivibrionales bacterium]|nr:GNAT family N-acetyltransferase [Chitinivibrionales bacterium]
MSSRHSCACSRPANPATWPRLRTASRLSRSSRVRPAARPTATAQRAMSEITVHTLDDSRRDEWRRFVAESNNGTVFHDPLFLDYHPADRFRFRHLLFTRDDVVLAALPGGVVKDEYRSPLGASFGGFVFAAGLSLKDADAVVNAFLGWCRREGIGAATLTPPMQVYHRTPDDVIEYSMLYNGFRLHNALYSSVIDFSRIRSKADLSRNTRHRINQSINKHVRIVQRNELERFYPILLENKAKFDTKPTHTLEELQRLEELLPGMMTLFMAYRGDEPIAGELLFAANDRCILNFYTMHRYEHRNLFAVNYLVEHAIRWCVAQGYRYYDYGVSADTFSDNPMEPSWSLVRFKESMGSTGCMRTTYRWTA